MSNGMNIYEHLVVVEGSSPQDLADKLKLFRLFPKVIQITNDGRKHWAWVLTSEKVLKKKSPNKFQGGQ